MKFFKFEKLGNQKIITLFGFKIKISSNSRRLVDIRDRLNHMATIDKQTLYAYWQINKIKEIELKQKIKEGKKVKVFFLMAEPSKFAMASIYREMEKSDLFEPYIYNVYYDKNNFISEDFVNTPKINFKYWKSLGYNVINGYDSQNRAIPLFMHNVDIVFMVDPVMFAFSSFKNYIINYNYLTCYIPYGMHTLNDKIYHFDFISVNQSWKVFAPSRIDYHRFLEESIHKGPNVVFFGYPRLDSYAMPRNTNSIPAKINNGNPIVIYAPHWSIEDKDRNNISTFHLYYKYFLNLVKQHENINFIFKPHPRLLPRLWDLKNDKNIMNPDEYVDYIKEWESCKNGAVIGQEEYIELFKNSACLITDCGSFVGEWLFSKKPCIYLVNPDLWYHKNKKNAFKDKYSEYGRRILDTYYICDTQNQIDDTFFNVMIKGQDSKKNDREKLAEEYGEHIGISGQQIVEYLHRILTY